MSNTGKLPIPLSAYTELIKSQMLEACQMELPGRRALVEQATRKGNKAHVRSLLAWSREQLAAHALFLRCFL